MDDVRAAFRAWEAARHAKNVPVCALRQPQLGCQRVSACVPHVFHFSKLFPSRCGTCIYAYSSRTFCVSLLSSKIFQISNVTRSVSRPILVNHRENVNIIIEDVGKLSEVGSKVDGFPSEILVAPVTCSIALILSQSDCPQSDSLAE